MNIDVVRQSKKQPSSAQEEYAHLLHEKLLRECKNDPKQFIQYVLSWGIPNWYSLCGMHQKWQDTLSKDGARRVLMLCPRDHAKTTMLPIGRVLWELGSNPNIRVKIVCQSDDIAIKRLSAIIDHIERNPRIKEVFPKLHPSEKGTWSKTKIYLDRHLISPDPSVEASGILTTAVGGRADLLVFDDPVDFRNAIQQPALREMIIDAYNDVWMNIVEPDGRVWYIGTPWTERDLTHKILKESPHYIKIIDKIDDSYTPVWSAKWSTELLVEKEKEIGKRAFSRAYKMKALSDEEALFPMEIVKKCEDSELVYGKLPTNSRGVRYFTGVDVGTGRSESGSYTVIFTGAYWKGKRIPVNILRGRFRSPEFARLLRDVNRTYRPDLIFVENNAAQEAIIQWVKEIYGQSEHFPIRGYFTGSQKLDEEIGLPAMAVEFEQGSWILPNMTHGGEECSCSYCVWIRELTSFPLGKYNDTVMASWLFREAIRQATSFEPKIRAISAPFGKEHYSIVDKLFEDEDDD